MEVNTLLVADYANVAERGKLNVMGIFQEIGAPKFPARHPQMYLIVGMLASPSEYDSKRNLTVKLINADATEEIMKFSQEFDVPHGSGGRRAEINLILVLRDIVFPKPGPYQFSVLIENDEKRAYSIELVESPKT
ncbi:MAG: hypothetical protein WB588_02380 [Dehalococcoidia bacterium]